MTGSLRLAGDDLDATVDATGLAAAPVLAAAGVSLLAIRGALERFGPVRIRTWADATSIEMSREGRTAFGF